MSRVPRDMHFELLHTWPTGDTTPPPKDHLPVKAIVFVHGILSDHLRFATCQNGLAITKQDWLFYYVDYDYHAPLADNGKHLSHTLRRYFSAQDEVIVVAHSMGGLITRIACLSHHLPFVRKVFLLATPNHGAFRTSSLSTAAQMARELTQLIWGLRQKKVGIIDLTRVTEIMARYIRDAQHVQDIDYISIPGRYFHDERGRFDPDVPDIWKMAFGGMDAGFELARGLLPLFSVKLDRAHDGIVEEASNNLIPEEPSSAANLNLAARTSEKWDSIRRARSDPRITYAHLVPYSARELVHVNVPDDPFVIHVISDIIDAPSLSAWLHEPRERYRRELAVYYRNEES